MSPWMFRRQRFSTTNAPGRKAQIVSACQLHQLRARVLSAPVSCPITVSSAARCRAPSWRSRFSCLDAGRVLTRLGRRCVPGISVACGL
jgi:hypothetical protein